MVNVVDLKENKNVLALVHEFYLAKHPNAVMSDLKVSAVMFGFVKVGKKVFALDTEGVGGQITPKKPFKVDWHICKPMQILLYPTCQSAINKKDMLELPVTKQVPLEEFVRPLRNNQRSFGSRLDSNYEVWRRTLTGN